MKPDEINYSISYPELTEEGQKETAVIIEKFRKQLFDVMNDTLYSFTSNLANEIVNDDGWINVRQKTKEALAGYGRPENYGGVNWQEVRKQILSENREAVINDIIKDKEKEIADLNNRINWMLNQNSF